MLKTFWYDWGEKYSGKINVYSHHLKCWSCYCFKCLDLIVANKLSLVFEGEGMTSFLFLPSITYHYDMLACVHAQPCPTLCDPLDHPARLLCPWDSWRGLPFSPPGKSSWSRIEPASRMAPALDSLPLSHYDLQYWLKFITFTFRSAFPIPAFLNLSFMWRLSCFFHPWLWIHLLSTF